MIRIGHPPHTPWPRRIDRWFTTITSCALNIALAAYILIAYSLT